jgi:hypothetical protein
MTTELRYFQRQALVEKLTRRFAKISGYEIEETLSIVDANHPQIQAWSLMAEEAVDEVESALSSKPKSEIVRFFLARHQSETHTGQKWEELAIAEGLDESEINELMDYLDDYH